ncbi:MAG: signal transduction protein [Flammeovirgaceae bacterium]|nr:signal transduction protein [Flammeovirgaceae bacterium]
MGDHIINPGAGDDARLHFISHLLSDINSLEYMLQNRLIEDDVIRVGAEQELCLVNDHWRPAKKALEVLESINDPHFTSELALYNAEIILDPLTFEGDAFSKMEKQLRALLQKAEVAATENDLSIILTGILPTISKHELDLEYMTPSPRYHAINNLLTGVLGSDFRMHFTGVDELSIAHNSMMFEACNTSFQMHLQINPGDFEQAYNWSQVIAGPVLGICANSPLLLGNELWSETRIALFQQSIDTRKISRYQNRQQARVAFGSSWVKGSVADFYKKEISKYRILLTKTIEEYSMQELEGGKVPKLSALNLHNGTIYRWNRPCYGVSDGKPHIRIENRYIPAGPTVADELANFAFWAGLMMGRPTEYNDPSALMDFEDVKSNFIKAARYGTDVLLNWMGRKVTLKQLVLDELLPMAQAGLKRMNIDSADIDRYLEIIRGRALSHTGSEWITKNYRLLKRKLKTDDALILLTKALHRNQKEYDTVSEWTDIEDHSTDSSKVTNVRHLMSTTLVTADSSDSALLTLQYMKWNNIHHLPVVNRKEVLVGLITWTHLTEHWDTDYLEDHSLSAADIMIRDIITVNNTASIGHAVSLMQNNDIGCLPVMQEGHLVGILTAKDLTHFENGRDQNTGS